MRSLQWKVKGRLGTAYDPGVAYEADSTVFLGAMTHKCKYCNVLEWMEKALRMCSSHFSNLCLSNHLDNVHFVVCVRKCNGRFSLTPFMAKKVPRDSLMPTFKVQGETSHSVNRLLPKPPLEVQFLQMDFMGEGEKELGLKRGDFPDVKEDLAKQLQKMLHNIDSYIKDLKTALDTVLPACKKFKADIRAENYPR